MADEVSRKVVVIRKKGATSKGQVIGPTTAESRVLERKRPSEKQRARRKKQSELWREAHPGLRYVQFVIEIELWNQFVARCCAEHRPNVVFTRMIREAVERSEAIEEILTQDKSR